MILTVFYHLNFLLSRSQQMSSKNLVRNTNIQVLKSRDSFVIRFAFLNEIVHGMRHAISTCRLLCVLFADQAPLHNSRKSCASASTL